MNLHEYQAKQLFSSYRIPVPRGRMVETPEEARRWAAENAADLYVVKAQIHAGGRGKAGGVKLTRHAAEVEPLAKGILGKRLVTHQTGPSGALVRRLLIEEGAPIERELYLSLLVDRAVGRLTLIASPAGGMDIEEVAATRPGEIHRITVDPVSGYQPFHGRFLAFRLNLEKETIGPFVQLVGGLYRLFEEKGASLVEVNPLVITKDKRVVALDGKVVVDDNALFRNEDIRAMRDLEEEDPLEVRASQYGLNYVKLDGIIGCMVNGAGLAMATMDTIKLAGSWPANFLDVGGGASKETVKQAFIILLSDPDVKGVFVNIFGGIVRCERIAGGIIEAAKEVKLQVPMVVRLEGTNREEGRRMLAESGLKLKVAKDLWDGAQTIVKEIQG
jgi:succinyl-CoA synthetase beta subunit